MEDEEKIKHNVDGRPISQIFYDEVHLIIKRFEDSGLENCQCVGVLEMIKFDLLTEANKNE